MNAHFPPEHCPKPSCGKPMVNTAYTPNKRGGAPTASDYASCLRKCPACRVGYSNARSNPTLIHEDPIANVPPEVHIGAREAVEKAINVLNRKNKLLKFGYNSSEDAVTWTLLAYLHGQQQQVLASLYQGLFGISATKPPALLLWGVPVPGGLRELELAQKLIAVSDALGEDKQRRTEPDVVLDFGASGLAVVEVKYDSRNESRPAANWHRYLPCRSAFKDSKKAEASGLYELVRNWRIAHDLAGERPFVVANLARDDTFATTPRLTDFGGSLATSSKRRFLRLPWCKFLWAAAREVGGFPKWMDDYLVERGLP